MKSLFSLTLFGLLTISSLGQKNASVIHGYYISRQGDTTYTDFYIKRFDFRDRYSRMDLQSKIRYKDEKGLKRMIIPENSREVLMYRGSDTLRLLSKINTAEGSNRPVFMECILKGKMNVYRYYNRQQGGMSVGMGMGAGMGGGMMMYGGGGSSVTEKFALEKYGQELFRPRGLFFKKDMAEYIPECPQLTKRIADMGYGMQDLMIIAEEYNSGCGRR